jgi:hypothetical protein
MSNKKAKNNHEICPINGQILVSVPGLGPPEGEELISSPKGPDYFLD